MSTSNARYTVSVDQKLFQRIEDFRYAGHFSTRSKATVELLKLGLETLERQQADTSSDPASSVPSLQEQE